MNTTTIYMRRTDKEGRLTVTEHRVWDADRFMATRHAEAVKEGGKSKAEQITRGDFLKARAPR